MEGTGRCVYYVDTSAALAYHPTLCNDASIAPFKLPIELHPFAEKLRRLRLGWEAKLRDRNLEERNEVLKNAYDALREYGEVVKYEPRQIEFFLSNVLGNMLVEVEDEATKPPAPTRPGRRYDRATLKALLAAWTKEKIDLPIDVEPPRKRLAERLFGQRIARQWLRKDVVAPDDPDRVTILSKTDEAFVRDHIVAAADERTGTWQNWTFVVKEPNVRAALLTYQDLRGAYLKQEVVDGGMPADEVAQLKHRFATAVSQTEFLFQYITDVKTLDFASPQLTSIVTRVLIPHVSPVPDSYADIRRVCFREKYWAAYVAMIGDIVCAQAMAVHGRDRDEIAALMHVPSGDVLGLYRNMLEEAVHRRTTARDVFFDKLQAFFDIKMDMPLVDLMLRQYRGDVPSDIWRGWEEVVFDVDALEGRVETYDALCTAYVRQLSNVRDRFKATWTKSIEDGAVRDWLFRYVDDEFGGMVAALGEDGISGQRLARVIAQDKFYKPSRQALALLQILLREELVVRA